ncbi:MAG TPA: GntR family transcriptional regulator [Candidatus Binatia bacterium]|jgi:DNA-binding GntR family transcriptional regulator
MGRIKTANPAETLVDQVVTYIQAEIAQDRLRANQKISESQVARQLKISRSPIREALRVLERDGLIRLIPGRGAHVIEVTPEDACEIFLLRSYLIGLAVRLATPDLGEKEVWLYKKRVKELERAASQSDPPAFLAVASEIEKFFAQYCGSVRLKRFIEMLGNPCLKYRAFLASVPGYMEEVGKLHKGIAQAIEKKNADRAESLRRTISEKGRKLIYQYFLSHGNKSRERKMLA